MATEMIGWVAAAILLLTITTQVYQQWKTRSTKGVSPWLFAGQLAASVAFTIYSALVGNIVFTVTNALMLLSAVVGQFLFWRNQNKAPAAIESIAATVGIPIAKPKRARSVRARAKTVKH